MDLAPCLLFFLLAFFSNPSVASPSSASRYIIQVEEPARPLTEGSLKRWHESFLPPAVEASGVVDRRLLHSYSDVFSGFAATLTEEELQAMGKKNGFVRAFPDRVLRVMTTHTPDFLGLKVGSKGLWNDSNLGSGVIIGVLDSGVTPGHPSYDDEGVPSPPSTWKGSCELETGCNNKLIGARSMIVDGSPPVDAVGHGTHTSATAAGNFVRNASYFGFAKGTAAGMAPRAHLAIYQVCGRKGNCYSADILAGLDAAVKDGVDILSLSLGGRSTPLDQDIIAIGSFAAAKKGIFVSCAGGNDGPDYFTVSNEAPWILTVAASSVDRSFRAFVKLPNGKVIPGESLDQPSNFLESSLPLYYPTESPYCNREPTDDRHRGSVWVCEVDCDNLVRVATFAKSHGAKALISISPKTEGATISIKKMDFPGVVLTIQDGSDIKSYLNSTLDPSASIVFNGTVLGVSPAPVVAFFSSRGPSQATPRIIKPDISGPGLNIFAAYIHSNVTPDQYKIESGTSMAAPHLSGVAALIKAVHPTWSPAAIRSAIITTADADVFDELLKPAHYFAKGAGHVNPNKAVDPGLIYDITHDDYVYYICGKFGEEGARNIAREVTKCSKSVIEEELNYPSILLAPRGRAAAKVTRTVTNVGLAKSSYTVSVSISKTVVSTTVTPETLTFNELNEQKSFTVSVKWGANGPPTSGNNQFVEGKLTWTSDDGKHVVTSPFIVSAY